MWVFFFWHRKSKLEQIYYCRYTQPFTETTYNKFFFLTLLIEFKIFDGLLSLRWDHSVILELHKRARYKLQKNKKVPLQPPIIIQPPEAKPYCLQIVKIFRWNFLNVTSQLTPLKETHWLLIWGSNSMQSSWKSQQKKFHASS